MNLIRNTIQRIIDGLENSPAPIGYFCLTFLFATSLRNFLELTIWGEYNPRELYWDVMHYYFSYICLALALMLIFHGIGRVSVSKSARVVLPSFLILNLVPLVDAIFSDVSAYAVGYMFPETHGPLWMRFVTFFGSMEDSGVTIGMRAEVAVVILAAFFYFRIKTASWLRSIVGALAVYALIFVYCAMPYGYAAVMRALQLPVQFTPVLFTFSYAVLGLALGAVVFFRAFPNGAVAILKDMRWLRLAHFELMFVLGIVGSYMTYGDDLPWSGYIVLKGTLVVSAIALAWLFAVMSNNVADEAIDAISNSRRPLICGVIDRPLYTRIMWIIFGLMLVTAVLTGFDILFLILVFTGNYFAYSMPPLRLKRIPFFSKVLIAGNSLVIIMVGMSFYGRLTGVGAGQLVFF